MTALIVVTVLFAFVLSMMRFRRRKLTGRLSHIRVGGGMSEKRLDTLRLKAGTLTAEVPPEEIEDVLAALARWMRPRSCIIDGEVVACGDDGIASFDHIRHRHHDASVFLCAFDLIELDGDDLRRESLAVRKATLASLLTRASQGLRFNEHMDETDGPLVFQQACKIRLEGIVSLRKFSFARKATPKRRRPP
jgi:bifunctional non-homologous end joining protein LigD